MKLTREILEREISAAKTALKAYEEGLEMQKLILKCFEDKIKTLPQKEKPLNKSDGIG